MNIDSTGFIDLLGGDNGGPECPNTSHPIHPSHAAMVRAQDAVYEAVTKDVDGEPATPELDAVQHAASNSWRTSSRMRLYRYTVQTWGAGGVVVVETLHFRCGVCGLTLPAQRVML